MTSSVGGGGGGGSLVLQNLKIGRHLIFRANHWCIRNCTHNSLYDVSVQGMDSGFAAGEDETYNVYDKAWRTDRDLATSIYKPSKNIDKDVYGDDLDKLLRTNR